MKKTLIVTFLLALAIGSYAQVFSLGIKAGYSTTLESMQNYPSLFNVSSNLQNGFNAGIYMRIGKRVYFQPEVIYNYLAYTNTFKNAAGQNVLEKKYLVSTVDVPVLAAADIVHMQNFKLRFMVGPKFSFNAGSSNANSIRENYEQKIRNYRIGLDCGVGFDFWRITLDVRYNLMPDMYKIQDSNNNTVNTPLLNAFQVSLGVRLFGNNM